MHKVHRRQYLQGVFLALLAASSFATPVCFAADATYMRASMSLDEPGEKTGLFISSSFEFDLPQALSEALHRGIALYFVHEFRLYKNRWYWLDKAVVKSRFIIRLAFDPLTRRYRLSYNGLSISFDTLEQALPYIKNIRRWRVAPATIIKNAEDFTAELRFYLDTDQLPKPMQVVNTGSSDWTISSEWITIPIPADVVSLSE